MNSKISHFVFIPIFLVFFFFSGILFIFPIGFRFKLTEHWNSPLEEVHSFSGELPFAGFILLMANFK